MVGIFAMIHSLFLYMIVITLPKLEKIEKLSVEYVNRDFKNDWSGNFDQIYI